MNILNKLKQWVKNLSKVNLLIEKTLFNSKIKKKKKQNSASFFDEAKPNFASFLMKQMPLKWCINEAKWSASFKWSSLATMFESTILVTSEPRIVIF